MMEAVQTSETQVNSYQSTRHYNPEDSLYFFSISVMKNALSLLMEYSVTEPEN
jgi:hypothetical protein